MNPDTIALIVIAAVVIVAVVAWILYKLGFRVKELTAKAGPLEAKMQRDQDTAKKAGTPLHRTEAAQDAVDGGQIKDSHIRAPADAAAKLTQKAAGPGSSITGSDIELKK